MLQSWAWGVFKSHQGWSAERVSTGGPEPRAMAQVLFRHKGPVSIGYIPRGPAVRVGDADSFADLLIRIDHVCKRHRALYLIVEPDRSLPTANSAEIPEFGAGPTHIQPARTVKVPMLADEALLAQMHQKTRYSVRLAERKGVVIDRHEGFAEQALRIFYQLLSETSDRNEFGIHTYNYYRSFLTAFGRDSLLLIASVESQPAAALIAASFGDEAIYMYGGSSSQHRAFGAAFNLQFEAMKWARERGKTWYDLWGIPSSNPAPDAENSDKVPATKGDDWRGLYRFKTGFGGQIIEYPGTLERVYHRLGARLARKLPGSRA